LYLDNAFSQAGPANENYARELFELHTLGEDRYYNHRYEKWSQVPGARSGMAEGYLDEDVYEAARAFTGWTVGMPAVVKGGLPETGEFVYYDPWHDHYQKRILGAEFESHQSPMADGRKVLDMLAAHPGTAQFLCKKICRWFVADDPPQSVVDRAAKTWMAHVDSEDQIARTLRTILLSPEFTEHLGQKIKRPNHLILSITRLTEAKLVPNESVYGWMRALGYYQFASPFPTGNPDGAAYWLDSDAMLKRWQTFAGLENIGAEKGIFAIDLDNIVPETCGSVRELIAVLAKRFWDGTVPKAIRKDLEAIFETDAHGLTFEAMRREKPEQFEVKIKQLLGLMFMAPEFQRR
ncbi:MAG: DUF1800 family protein, partial [Bacteroidota bacterium]